MKHPRRIVGSFERGRSTERFASRGSFLAMSELLGRGRRAPGKPSIRNRRSNAIPYAADPACHSMR